MLWILLAICGYLVATRSPLGESDVAASAPQYVPVVPVQVHTQTPPPPGGFGGGPLRKSQLAVKQFAGYLDPQF